MSFNIPINSFLSSVIVKEMREQRQFIANMWPIFWLKLASVFGKNTVVSTLTRFQRVAWTGSPEKMTKWRISPNRKWFSQNRKGVLISDDNRSMIKIWQKSDDCTKIVKKNNKKMIIIKVKTKQKKIDGSFAEDGKP